MIKTLLLFAMACRWGTVHPAKPMPTFEPSYDDYSALEDAWTAAANVVSASREQREAEAAWIINGVLEAWDGLVRP